MEYTYKDAATEEQIKNFDPDTQNIVSVNVISEKGEEVVIQVIEPKTSDEIAFVLLKKEQERLAALKAELAEKCDFSTQEIIVIDVDGIATPTIRDLTKEEIEARKIITEPVIEEVKEPEKTPDQLINEKLAMIKATMAGGSIAPEDAVFVDSVWKLKQLNI